MTSADRGTVKMSDVARLAGVSKMTVSNVVNNRPGVSDPVRRRVIEVIRESGYRINVSARTLKSGRTGVLGLALPNLNNAYFGLLADHVVDQAGRLGFHVAIEQTGAVAEGEINAIAHSHTLQFDGLILSAVGIDPQDQRLPGGDFPIVMLGEQDFAASFDHVAMPNEDGAKAACELLVDRGCRKIAMVTGADLDGVNAVTRRHYGYLSGLEERGLPAEPDLLMKLDEFSATGGRRAGHRMVDEGLDFDGVVAVTDNVAQGIVRGFADRGVSVPGDVRVIGFDDIPEAELMVPSLSTVAPDHGWMAAKAVELVTARLDDPSRPAAQHVAPFTLVERESTR